MTQETRSTAIAAGIIFLVFSGGWIVMPWVMRTVGDYSAAVAGAIAVLFVVGFFLVFWLRARHQQRKGD